MEAFADELMRGGVWMQFVWQGQASVVVGAVELGAVEVVELGIARAALRVTC